MKDIKPGRKHRHKAYCFAFFTGVAIVGLFFQAWRVHAYDIQDSVRHVPAHAAQAATQQTLPVPVQTPLAGAAVAPAAHEDRWSDGDVVAAMSSFYQSIITYMGILIGIMGVLSVFTLRFLSKAAAEDMAHDAAKAAMLHYLETTKFREEVSYAIQDIGLSTQLEFLERELVEIKKLLKDRQPASADTSEDEEGTIEFPPKPEGA
jgi:hypothetical protein